MFIAPANKRSFADVEPESEPNALVKAISPSLSGRQLESVQEAWALWPFATGKSFGVFEDELFLRAMAKTHATIKMPTEDDMRTKILPSMAREVDRSNNKSLEPTRHLSLFTDGWSSCRNDSLINYLTMGDDRIPIFLGAHDMSGTSHTAEHLYQHLSDHALARIPQFIDHVWPTGKGKLVAVVTDSASTMTAMRKKISQVHMHCMIKFAFKSRTKISQSPSSQPGPFSGSDTAVRVPLAQPLCSRHFKDRFP
jgi:hypothetical protein